MRAVPGLGCCGFLFFFFFLFPPSSPFSSLSPSIALVEIFIVGGETKEGFRGPKTKLGCIFGSFMGLGVLIFVGFRFIVG